MATPTETIRYSPQAEAMIQDSRIRELSVEHILTDLTARGAVYGGGIAFLLGGPESGASVAGTCLAAWAVTALPNVFLSLAQRWIIRLRDCVPSTEVQ